MSAETMAAVTEAYLERWRGERFPRLLTEVYRPAPSLRCSEWAERNRVLTKGPMAGQLWRNEEAPYLVEIMDTISDPHRPRKAVVIKSARVGYTEGVIGNGVGYLVDQEPSDVIVMHPTDEEAESYSKEHLDPMFRQTPALRKRLHLDSYKDSRNTITYKAFAGGSLSIIGPKGSKLRRRSGRVAFSDEIDELEEVYEQGDPLLRLDKRLDDFDDALHFRGSTPTTTGTSRIEKEWLGSDQRRWFVSCPHCHESQVLKWSEKGREVGIAWDKEVVCTSCGAETEYGDRCSSCESEALEVRHLPETAHYVCTNGCRIEEHDKPAMIRGGAWIPTKAGGLYPGWHVHALLSLFAGASWSKLVGEFLGAKDDPEALKVFVNTVLGETWDDRAVKVDGASLERRAEQWPSDVPDGVGLLTAAVDVQGDRLELLVEGWGLGEERWDVLHERVVGDPEAHDTWARLDALLTKSYRHANGGDMRVRVAFVDARYATDAVYSFVKPREGRGVHACIGDAGAEGTPPVKRPTKPNKAGVKVFSLGVFGLKESLLKRLQINRPGPRFIHFRSADHSTEGVPPRYNGFDAEYFAQFGAEKIVTGIVKGSRRPVRRFVQTRARNEAIDLHVYNMAAFQSLGAAVRLLMPEWVEQARKVPPKEPEQEKPPEGPEPDGGGNWATGGGRWGSRW